ncbi:MAG: hypothetical protein LBM63_05365 [Rikenellaceae bacterium]|jgi:hypothetical protein|nr:hypothetical protein [Rikenellaceae bacterium]
MTAIEIAALLGIYYPTAKRHIRAIKESGIASGDYTMTCTVGNMTVRPEYYGLEMIAAVAFRVKSWQGDRFRQWLIERAVRPVPQSRLPIAIFVPVRENRLSN